jgi:hypothetical protein
MYVVRLVKIIKLKHLNKHTPSRVITVVEYLILSQDEICKSIAEKGGIDVVLNCIDDSGEQGNKEVAKVCCSLLSKV